MYEHTYEHRVRYRECDPMGVVYHTHYLDYFEAARTEALRDLGVAYRDIEESGIIMPVVSVEVNYKQPAHYDDLLHVRTIFAELPSVRVPIDYEVTTAGDDRPIVTGQVTLCFMDAERQRPTHPPAPIQRAFERAFEVASSEG